MLTIVGGACFSQDERGRSARICCTFPCAALGVGWRRMSGGRPPGGFLVGGVVREAGSGARLLGATPARLTAGRGGWLADGGRFTLTSARLRQRGPGEADAAQCGRPGYTDDGSGVSRRLSRPRGGQAADASGRGVWYAGSHDDRSALR